MKRNLNEIIWQARGEAKSNWLKAEQTLKDAINVFPGEKALYNELGDLYFKKELFEEAAKKYQVTYSLDSNNIDTTFKLGFCYLIGKNFDKAVYYFDKVSDKIPEAAYNKAVALCRLNRNFEAIKLLEKLVDDFVYSERPYILLAKLYLEYERFDKIITLVAQGERFFGKLPELTFIRASMYFYTRQWMRAFIDFRDSELIVRTNPLYYRMYALTSEKIGLTSKAVSLLKNCINDYPMYFGAYYDLIKILIAHNRYNESVDIVEQLYKQGVSFSDIDASEREFFKKVFNDF